MWEEWDDDQMIFGMSRWPLQHRHRPLYVTNIADCGAGGRHRESEPVPSLFERPQNETFTNKRRSRFVVKSTKIKSVSVKVLKNMKYRPMGGSLH